MNWTTIMQLAALVASLLLVSTQVSASNIFNDINVLKEKGLKSSTTVTGVFLLLKDLNHRYKGLLSKDATLLFRSWFPAGRSCTRQDLASLVRLTDPKNLTGPKSLLEYINMTYATVLNYCVQSVAAPTLDRIDEQIASDAATLGGFFETKYVSDLLDDKSMSYVALADAMKSYLDLDSVSLSGPLRHVDPRVSRFTEVLMILGRSANYIYHAFLLDEQNDSNLMQRLFSKSKDDSDLRIILTVTRAGQMLAELVDVKLDEIFNKKYADAALSLGKVAAKTLKTMPENTDNRALAAKAFESHVTNLTKALGGKSYPQRVFAKVRDSCEIIAGSWPGLVDLAVLGLLPPDRAEFLTLRMCWIIMNSPETFGSSSQMQ